MANRWGNSRNCGWLYFGVSKITADGDHSHEIKRRLLLGRKVMINLDSIFFLFVFYSFNFKIFNSYMCSQTCTPLPPPSPSHPWAPALSTLSHASNLYWRSISHMIIYMFQCCSLKSSHPHLLPQSPKVCSLHLCLFCCLAYRVIVTIFLNSIYMR